MHYIKSHFINRIFIIFCIIQCGSTFIPTLAGTGHSFWCPWFSPSVPDPPVAVSDRFETENQLLVSEWGTITTAVATMGFPSLCYLFFYIDQFNRYKIPINRYTIPIYGSLAIFFGVLSEYGSFHYSNRWQPIIFVQKKLEKLSKKELLKLLCVKDRECEMRQIEHKLFKHNALTCHPLEIALNQLRKTYDYLGMLKKLNARTRGCKHLQTKDSKMQRKKNTQDILDATKRIEEIAHLMRGLPPRGMTSE